MVLDKGHFELIQEDNSLKERERQWEHTGIVFSEFKKYLKNKGASNSIIKQQLEHASSFVFNYFFIYNDSLNVLDTNETTIKTFIGNWYIRKCMDATIETIRELLLAIYDFFQFINEYGFINSRQFEEIKQTCNQKEWFENRLKSYATADGFRFMEWIEEYNYD